MRRLLPVSLRLGAETVVDGLLVELEAGRVEVELKAPLDQIAVGSGVVVYPEGERNLELVGVLERVEAQRLIVELTRTGHREDRWSPREKGHVRFRVRPLGEDATWQTPDPRVELSLTGLAFLHPHPVPEGPLELDIEGGEGRRARVSAEVVRVDPTRYEDLRRVSTTFIGVSEAAGATLAELLGALQDAALEAWGEASTLDLSPPDADVAEQSK